MGTRRVLRLRHGHLAVRGRAGGSRRLPHGRAQLFLPRLRERGQPGQVVSGPTRDEFVALARDYTVVPVWREVLADLETPVSAFAKLVRDREGFLLESVEHGEHWGRFSFIGRDPALTLVARGPDVEIMGDAIAPGVPRDEGILAALEALLSWYRAPSLPDLPPFHGGLVGYLGYDVVREVERLTEVPPDDNGFPDAVVDLIGSLVAFDHFRQRLFLIENVFLAPGADAGDEYERAQARLDARFDELAN